MKLVGVLAAIFTATLSPSVAWADLVTNGSFVGCSGQTCTDWMFTPAASGSFFGYNDGLVGGVTPIPASYASFGAYGIGDDEISQALATVAGQSYTISFDLGLNNGFNDGLPDQDFSVYFGLTPIFAEADTGSTNLTTFTFDATATSSSTELDFFGRNFLSYNVLTDVSVVPSSVTATPLPAALPLFATGLGALGLLGWRRKRKNAAAIAVA